MRKLDILRKKLRNLKKVNDIYYLDVDEFANPGEFDVWAQPIVALDPIADRMMVVGVDIIHSYPTPERDLDWAPEISTWDEAFYLTPPDRIKWDD